PLFICFEPCRDPLTRPTFPTRRSSDLASLVHHRRAVGRRHLRRTVARSVVHHDGPVPGGQRAEHSGQGGGLVEAGQHHIDQFHTDRKSTRLNSSHVSISYAVFCLKKKI